MNLYFVICRSFRKILASLSTIVSALIGLIANSSAPYSRTLVFSLSSSAIANILIPEFRRLILMINIAPLSAAVFPSMTMTSTWLFNSVIISRHWSALNALNTWWPFSANVAASRVWMSAFSSVMMILSFCGCVVVIYITGWIINLIRHSSSMKLLHIYDNPFGEVTII